LIGIEALLVEKKSNGATISNVNDRFMKALKIQKKDALTFMVGSLNIIRLT
jgi:hypothetical protein